MYMLQRIADLQRYGLSHTVAVTWVHSRNANRSRHAYVIEIQTLSAIPRRENARNFGLVARELLGDRPLDEFGIMNEIAEATLNNHSGLRF
jgi:hypothetical protein